MFVRDVGEDRPVSGGVCVDISALLSNCLSGRMQFKVGDDLGRFLVINSTDLGQHVSLMCFCHKFVACVFIHQYFFIFFYLIVMFLMTIL